MNPQYQSTGPDAERPLYSVAGGDGEPLLLMLHGAGANCDVWAPMLQAIDENWRGSWIAPDLLGHGRSPKTSNYSLACQAAAVAKLFTPMRDSLVTIIGHSMGAGVAAVLGTQWFGVTIDRIFAIGLKVHWSNAEIANLRTFAAKEPKVYPARPEALARYLKASGLAGIVADDSPALEHGIVEVPEGWTLACPPAAVGSSPQHIEAVLGAVRCRLFFARGQNDAVATAVELQKVTANLTEFQGVGHNAMIENPDAVWEWVRRMP